MKKRLSAGSLEVWRIGGRSTASGHGNAAGIFCVGEYGVWTPPRYGKVSSGNDDEPVDFGVSCFRTNANGRCRGTW